MKTKKQVITGTNWVFSMENRPVIDYYCCPNCHENMVERESNYCRHCGVELEWRLKIAPSGNKMTSERLAATFMGLNIFLTRQQKDGLNYLFEALSPGITECFTKPDEEK